MSSEAFNTLRTNSEKDQVSASIAIIRRVVNEECPETSQELNLVVKRALRGLGAQSCSSRCGFFTTFSILPEIFKSPRFTVQMCLLIIEKELEAYSKQDLADVCKGHILAYSSLVNSDKIFEASDDEIGVIINKIISVRNVKSYLMLSAHLLLVGFLKKIKENTFKNKVWPIIQSKVIGPNNYDKKILFYHMLSVLSNQFPNVVNSAVLREIIGAPAVFHESTINDIGTSIVNVDGPGSSLLTVYENMLQGIISEVKFLKKFWNIVCESLTSVSESRIKMVFMFFSFIISEIKNKNWIRHMLKTEFVLLLVSELHENIEPSRLKAIKTLTSVIQDKGTLKAGAQKTIVEKLIFYPGNFKFLSNPTGSQLINSLLNNFDIDNFRIFADLFCAVICDQSQRCIFQVGEEIPRYKPWRDSNKKTACMLLSRLLNVSVVDNCIEFKAEVLKTVSNVAFFKKDASYKLQKTLQSFFFHSLDNKKNTVSDLVHLYKMIIFHINLKLVDNEWTCFNVSDKFMKSWKIIIDSFLMFKDVSGENESDKLGKNVYEMIFCLLAIMMLKDAEFAENAYSVIKELHTTYMKMLGSFRARGNGLRDKIQRTISQRDGESSEDELLWTDVIVDLILSLISNESRIQRNILTRIFIYLCPYLTSHNINQLLRVLNPSEAEVMMERNENSVRNETERNEKSDSDIDSHDDSVELDSGSENDSEMSVEIDDNQLQVLRSNLQNALQTEEDAGSIDLDDMTEEDGRRLDESLCEAFKQIEQYKKKTQAAEQVQINILQSRVLDLLGVYLKADPEIGSIIDIMVAVLMLLENLVNNDRSVDLQNRLRLFLKKLTSLKQSVIGSSVNHASLKLLNYIPELLKKLIDRGERTSNVYRNMKEEIVECCTFILKFSLKKEDFATHLQSDILAIYKTALRNFLTKKNCITPVVIFQKAFTLPWDGAFLLVDLISDLLEDKTIPMYRFQHICFLLYHFFQNGRLFTSENKTTHKAVIDRILQCLIRQYNALKDLSIKVRKQYIQLIEMIKIKNIAPEVVKMIDITYVKKDLISSNESEEKVLPRFDCEDTESEESDNESENAEVYSEDTQKIEFSKEYSHLGQSNKRKHREALKLKKRNKMRRTENLSEGLTQGLFGNHLSARRSFMEGDEVPSEEDEE